MTVANPCSDQVTLTIPGPHFLDKSYDLGSAESLQTWDKMLNLVNSDSWVDCGDILIDFYLDDGSKTLLDPLIFSDLRTTVPNEFTYLQTFDFAHIGTYDIKYNAYYENYLVNAIES